MTVELNSYRYSELRVGQTEVVTLTVDQAKVDAFVALSGDSNPLHTDAEYCRSRRLPGVVAHGWLTGSAISTLIGMRLPGRYSRFLSAKVSWPKPVFVGDQVEISGEVSSLSEATHTLELKLRGRNQRGDLVLRGEALVEVLE